MIEKIKCTGCGQVKRWDKFICLDTCICLQKNEEVEQDIEFKDLDYPELHNLIYAGFKAKFSISGWLSATGTLKMYHQKEDSIVIGRIKIQFGKAIEEIINNLKPIKPVTFCGSISIKNNKVTVKP